MITNSQTGAYHAQWERERGTVYLLEIDEVAKAVTTILRDKFDPATGFQLYPAVEQVFWAGPEKKNAIIYSRLTSEAARQYVGYNRRRSYSV